MEQALQVFSNEALKVKIRALTIDGEPWAVGKDVAEALGYKDTYQAIKKNVDEEDKLNRLIDSAGGQKRTMTLINEGGLYCLMLRSTLPEAKKFRRWVTSEVLPSIRKTGEYKIKKEDKPFTRTVEDVTNALNDGYLIGYEAGKKEINNYKYNEGYKDGYESGHRDGVSNWRFSADKARLYNEGYQKGYEAGYNAAFDQSYKNGFKKGYAIANDMNK